MAEAADCPPAFVEISAPLIRRSATDSAPMTAPNTQNNERSGENGPRDVMGLCLLSLDGGGVRGLSTLYILKVIMDALSQEQGIKLKPCDVFDMVAGTSTGGLIAIMLGRLEMSVDECIAAYTELMDDVFGVRAHRFPINVRGKAQARFSSEKLKAAIEKVLVKSGIPSKTSFNDGVDRKCKVFVCTAARETTGTTRLRSYDMAGDLGPSPSICEAALATSAATGFFEPVMIGHRQFVDGAIGANNPVEELENEISNVWSPQHGIVQPLVKCLLSVGTGHPTGKALEDDVARFLSVIVKLVTETTKTAERFMARWRREYEEKRYFRFNVDQGLQDVGLAEYQKQGIIQAATQQYITTQAQKFQIRDCVNNLKTKEKPAERDLALKISEFNVQRILALREPPKLVSRWHVPLQRNLRFVGRDTELVRLKMLLSSNTYEKVAIFGLGGVGKTQIALEFAWRLRDTLPNCTIFWIVAVNMDSVIDGFRAIDRALLLSDADSGKPHDVVALLQRVCDYFSLETAGRWVLIFDSADDEDLFLAESELLASSFKTSKRLIDYIPKGRHGTLIFTTRSRKLAVKVANVNVMKIVEMDEALGRELLGKSLVQQQVLDDDQSLNSLLRQLTFLPLAIVQAAAYINENDITLIEYLTLLEDKEEENVIELLSEDFEDDGRYRDIQNPVAMTWIISFKQVQQKDVLAATYLKLMCCFYPHDIPQSLLPPAPSMKKYIDAIGTLTAYSFISKRRVDPNSIIQSSQTSHSNMLPEYLFNMHRLVHLATRNWLSIEGILGNLTDTSTTRMAVVFPESKDENRTLWRLYFPHVRYLLDCIASQDVNVSTTEKMDLLRKYRQCLYKDGRYIDSERSYQEVLKWEEATKTIAHPDTLSSMGGLAAVFDKQGRWDEAASLALKTVDAAREMLGKQDDKTMGAMEVLSNVYWNQGLWKDAEALDLEVLEGKKIVFGSDDPRTLRTMSSLASNYYNMGRWEEAERLASAASEGLQKVLGPGHLQTLESKSCLSAVFWNQGRWKEAEELDILTLEARKKILGTTHPDTLLAMNNLMTTYWQQGRWLEAEDLGLQVVEGRKERLGTNHPYTLVSVHNLAMVYMNQGRLKEAEKLELGVIALKFTSLGEDHPETLISRHSLAIIYKRQDRLREAEELGKLIFEARKRVLGKEHPETLVSMNSISAIYRSQERWSEARALASEVLQIRDSSLGPDHPDTLRSIHNLAIILKAQESDSEARMLMEKCCLLRKNKLGDDHPDTKDSARLLADWGRGEERSS